MLDSQFDRLRAEIGDAVRQPDFASVRGRAAVRARRRRTAAMVVAVLIAAGFGFAVDRSVAGPDQVATVVPEPGFPRTIWLTSAGEDLYTLLEPCPDCAAQLHVSSDGGVTWTRRELPPMPEGGDPSREGTLHPLSTGLVAWRENNRGTRPDVPGVPFRPWITRDAGRTWTQTVIDIRPVGAVPDGLRPVDCALFELPTCTIGVIDPDTGRYAPLRNQPTGITVEYWWTSEVTVPLDGRLWVPGLDPATGLPAVASSTDGGLTWHTHVFTDGAPEVPALDDPDRDFKIGLRYQPKVAAGPDGTAYVVIFRSVGKMQVYSTNDGGLTWQAGAEIPGAEYASGFVAADGAHIIRTATGFVTGPDTPVTLPGFPEKPSHPVRVSSRQSTVPYLVTSGNIAYRSADGRTWQQIRLP